MILDIHSVSSRILDLPGANIFNSGYALAPMSKRIVFHTHTLIRQTSEPLARLNQLIYHVFFAFFTHHFDPFIKTNFVWSSARSAAGLGKLIKPFAPQEFLIHNVVA